jgi:hypothetical protein
MKNFFKIKTLFLVIIFTMILLTNVFSTQKVQAHSDLDWLLVDGSAESLKLYSEPTPSKLQIAEIIITNNFQPGDTLDIQILREKFNDLSTKNFSAVWRISNGVDFTGDNLITPLQSTGSYFINIDFIDNVSSNILISESLYFEVGEGIQTFEDLYLNNSSIAWRSSNILNRTDPHTFEVSNPDTNSIYEWDMGDTKILEGAKVSHVFGNTQTPVYVTLRMTDKITNVFKDNYVRVDLTGSQGLGVNQPPVVIPVSGTKLPESYLTFSDERLKSFVLPILLIYIVILASKALLFRSYLKF